MAKDDSLFGITPGAYERRTEARPMESLTLARIWEHIGRMGILRPAPETYRVPVHPKNVCPHGNLKNWYDCPEGC